MGQLNGCITHNKSYSAIELVHVLLIFDATCGQLLAVNLSKTWTFLVLLYFGCIMTFVCISAPCLPRNILALMDCQSGSAILSWQPGTGALQYTATAVAESGQNISCQSNNTNCELTGLACGETYNITVLAKGQTCSSVASMSGGLKTGENTYNTT